MNCLQQYRRLTPLAKTTIPPLLNRTMSTDNRKKRYLEKPMHSKFYPLGPLDNVDQRGNHLHRLLDKLDREVTMRVWQETCKVVDVLNKDSPLERREIPVVFLKQMATNRSKLVYYPPRDIPAVIEPGTLMWWSIDDVFEVVINPGYGLFATAEHVREYGKDIVLDSGEEGVSAEQEDSYGDPELRELLQSSVFRFPAPVDRNMILEFLRNELNLFVPSEKSIVLSQKLLLTPGEHTVSLKINQDHSEELKVMVL